MRNENSGKEEMVPESEIRLVRDEIRERMDGESLDVLDSSIKFFIYRGLKGGSQRLGTIIDDFTDVSWFGKAGEGMV